MKLDHPSILQSFFQTTQITVAIGLAFLIYPNSQLTQAKNISSENRNQSILLSQMADSNNSQTRICWLNSGKTQIVCDFQSDNN